jgi:hypothetical protein
MRRDDVRFAAAARDDGLRKISRYTWRAGAAGVACSALMAVAFGHHVATQSGTASTQQSGSGNGQTASRTGQPASGNVPTAAGSAQPTSGTGKPAPRKKKRASGNGQPAPANQQPASGNGQSGSGGGTIVVPTQPPAPAQGGAPVTSGGS